MNSSRVSGSALSWDDFNSVSLDKWPIVYVLLLKIRVPFQTRICLLYVLLLLLFL